ncbi:unnamed protein product [Bursaphelenchus xylophilus]|uniref:(pine wood nematode) hypothetical protein n=1 Tax=Bursaphelenchus xylophilus TaxID=6326 RepID=A0A1I7SSZ7_BURXY|nr:unnamed protein product [Bursaphelenchus xylophilus]CAG9108825.1 unnamed protein product [Bursaphelenchus xylophilus]
MNSPDCVIVFLLFVLAISTAHRCHQGYHGHSKIGYCNSEGCALVRWAESNKDEYMCVSKLGKLANFQFECPHTHQRSKCIDKHTEHSDASNPEIQRQVVEVLEEAGIDRICCCRGHNCNTANEDIGQYFGHVIKVAPESQAYSSHGRPVRPRDPDDDFNDDTPREREPSSAYSLVASFLIILFSSILY